MSKTLFIVSDYGTGDPAFAEVILRLRNFLPKVFIYPVATPPFSTINTGFWIYQLALTPDIHNTFIFSNTAPRIENKDPQKENGGEKLMYAKLANGFEIIAVNAGFVFSFIKPHIEEFAYVHTKTNGSQFRSRDYFPESVSKLLKRDYSFVGKAKNITTIPDYPTNKIASIDGYGNIKTTLRKSSISYPLSSTVTITIGAISQKAIVSDGIFNVLQDSLVFAPGSAGHNDPFMEIVVRGGNASYLFNHPHVEEAVSIKG